MSRRRGPALLVIALAMAVSMGSCGGGNGGGGPAPARECAALPPATAADFVPRITEFVRHECHAKQNWEHDAEVRTSDGVHFLVKVWYSPSLFAWLTVGNREAPVPDGSVLIKEEHASADSPIRLWSVMAKDSQLSWDGWYWVVVDPKSESQPAQPSNGCAEAVKDFTEAGAYCVNCHASAIANQETYASTAYLQPGAASSGNSAGSTAPWLESLAHLGLSGPGLGNAKFNAASGFTGRVSNSIFANVRSVGRIPCMVPESMDHVYSPAASNGGPPQFLTSDQCSNCHDASSTLEGLTPNMIYGGSGSSPANLSPYGEWRYSMMGLAGRDPIFFAQLDTESTLHRNLAGQPNGSAFVQDLCLRCHGVMGERQFHIDKGPEVLLTRDALQDPKSKYGALARDGVSCTVCHHMSNDNLGDPSTYTGLFNVGPPTEVYGPYPSNPDPTGAKTGDSVIPLPMHNALGITPLQGLQVQQASLCASCHTIVLPVYDANGNQVIENGRPKVDYEQTTYLEWLNSSSAAVPCQKCHMPDAYQNTTDLQFKIANIEDDTFPRIPHTGPSTRLPDADLILEPRPYNRHQLLGINLFALEMFDQFRTELGLYKVNPNLPSDLATQISGQRFAVAGAVQEAQTGTTLIAVQSVSKAEGQLDAYVMVQNLAGHNFPSGVSFRRAFVNFLVLDAYGHILWASGNTDANGVIVDSSGSPLKTEFFSPSQQTIQPHFWTGNPITSDQQVEIYEELVLDPQGLLTTSFLSLDHKVKDNRIQPEGRSSTGPDADITAPVGTGDDPSYQNGCGCSLVRYQVPLAAMPGGAASVRATLYYQSIPPYYLRQRSEQGKGGDTARLITFASQLDLSRYPEISDWKLQVGTSGVVAIP